VLTRVVDFASALVKCDSCLIYVLEAKNWSCERRRIASGRGGSAEAARGAGITGWVAEHREPVAVAEKAALDPRFQFFHNCLRQLRGISIGAINVRGLVVGVINLQHRQPHNYRSGKSG